MNEPIQAAYLLDSDFLIGWYLPKDAHHEHASQLFPQVLKNKSRLGITSLVITEVATVLSAASGADTARQFLRDIRTSGLPVHHITRKLFARSLELFESFNQKRISVVDCSNVVVYREYDYNRLLAFDGFYYKHYDIMTASEILEAIKGQEDTAVVENT